MASPNLQIETPAVTNHFKVFAVGGDQPRAVRSRSERNENIEVQIAEFFGSEMPVASNFRQQLA